MPEVSKNEDGTWHAPGAGDHALKRDAEAALEAHQQELQQARLSRTGTATGTNSPLVDPNNDGSGDPSDRTMHDNRTGHPGADTRNMTPQELQDATGNAAITPRPARRADLTGQARTLDALGNPRS